MNRHLSPMRRRPLRKTLTIVAVTLVFTLLRIAPLDFNPTSHVSFDSDKAMAAGSDASVVEFTQCANGVSPSDTAGCSQGWINGTLNANNSHYREDYVVPQRFEVFVPTGGSLTGRTLTFRYETRKGTTHAYDSLATWNFTQNPADRCQGLTAADCVGGNPSTFPIPDDNTSVPPAGAGISTITADHM